MKGRKPKPTKLRLIQGNPGKRPINKREAKPPVGMPPCPEHLNEMAKKKWKEKSQELFALGILTKIDGDLLAGYCQAYSRWQDAEERLKDMGPTIVNAGRVQPNPLIRISKDALATMLRLGVEYGITPSSRSRIQTTPLNPHEEKEKGFFG